MVTETACLIGDGAGHPGGHVLHGVDCLPDLIEVNSQVFGPNASMGGAR